jgi:formylglycine-generating enzyme required for sulfatase activity
MLLTAAMCASVGCVRTHNNDNVSREEDTSGAQAGAEMDVSSALRKWTGIKMALIPAGEFTMGSPKDEKRRQGDEGPQHRVRITKPFYLGIYEVTQEEYIRVTGRNPSGFCVSGLAKELVAGLKTARFPVETVTWYDAVEFCNRLSEKEGLPAYYRLTDVRRDRHTKYEQTDYERRNVVICIASATVEVIGGRGYRLPTEAEWEYACRAGTTTPFSFGEVLNGRQANCLGSDRPYGTDEAGPYLGRTAAVGSYPPNAFGLYDMHGNVWEWCADLYDARFYGVSSLDDPTGPSSPRDEGAWWDPSSRVVRGGTYGTAPQWLRSACRGWKIPGERSGVTGFRVARDAGEGENHSTKK